TLLELLVSLAVLGMLTGAVAFAFRPGAFASLDPGTVARAEAIRTGSAQEVVVGDSIGRGPLRRRFLPDGRALGPGLDALTGVPSSTSARAESW
ncbi:MAG TPA: hypothetical protein VFO06_00135, partial [Gemmatimonadales bacterium]|nr:hypothetical protein [Gemmatimonadales bacterium]